MSEHRLQRAFDYVRDAQLSIGVSALMTAMDLLDRGDLMVRANNPFGDQMVHALPSALAVPEITGNAAADLSLQVSSAFAATELARRTSSVRQIASMAIASQVVSCGVDAGVDRSGWLSKAELAKPDVGFSAIAAALVSKYLLDRAERAPTRLRRNLWRAGMATFAGSLTAGSYYLFGHGGEQLNLSSHAAGLAVGTAVHVIDHRNRGQGVIIDQPETEMIQV